MSPLRVKLGFPTSAIGGGWGTAAVGQNLPFEVTIQIALNPTVNRMAVWLIAQTHIKQLFNTKSAAF